MPPVKPIAAIAACCALLTIAPPSRGTILEPKRNAASDLEITGMVAGIAPGTVQYISYQHLLALPKVTVAIQPDENFSEIAHEKIIVTGIYLDVLAKSIGAQPDSDLIGALCSDGYRANFPNEYILAHRPIFALKVNGLPVKVWAAQTHHHSPGTYFITHEIFVPSFKVLSHEEMPQIPAEIVKLDFDSSRHVFSTIAPRGDDAQNPQIDAGYRIARQHCFRCHNMGSYGGVKAGRTWQTLGTRAATSPSSFESYVHDPKSIDPNATMSPNPSLDATTLKALQAYFQTFSSGVH
jgi:hypothetical protein